MLTFSSPVCHAGATGPAFNSRFGRGRRVQASLPPPPPPPLSLPPPGGSSRVSLSRLFLSSRFPPPPRRGNHPGTALCRRRPFAKKKKKKKGSAVRSWIATAAFTSYPREPFLSSPTSGWAAAAAAALEMAGREQGARRSLRAGLAARAGAAAAWESRFLFGLTTACGSGSPARRTSTSLSFDEVPGLGWKLP